MPAANALILKRDRSIIGNRTRVSASTKAPTVPRPRAIKTMYSRDQPSRAPSMSPTRKTVSPPEKSTFPMGSSFSPRLRSEVSLSLK